MGKNGPAIVVDSGPGWVLMEPDEKGRPLYVGKDNYWTRVKQAATPWIDHEDAVAAAEALNHETPRRRD